MATVCTNCGQELPRDDAHFCSHCGTLVPSHPFSAQSLAAKSVESEKPVLREQRVQLPSVQEAQAQQSPRTTRRIDSDGQSVDANLAGSSGPPRTTRRIAPDDAPQPAIAWPAPLTHVSVREQRVENRATRVEAQRSQPVQQAATGKSSTPQQEVPVEVQEQRNVYPPTPLPENRKEELQDAIEDRPTTPLETAASQSVEDAPTAIQSTVLDTGDVEHLDTVPVPNYPQKQSPAAPRQPVASPLSLHNNTNPSVEQRTHAQQSYVANTPLPASQSVSSSQRMSRNISQGQLHPPLPPQQNVQATTPPPVMAGRRQKSRIPFIVLLACICVFILGGGAWIILANPFAVPAVTQPLQSYKDTRLGVALSYPSGWTTQKNATGVVLADSSHTAQVKLSAIATDGDAAKYIQQQATKSGMTAIKTLGTASFAGATWQHVQGNMLQDGANYTANMFVTMHGDRMYVLMQMAPQNVYADEESVVFSPMRGSFAFL